MQRPVLVDERDDAVDELLAFVVADLAQRDVAAEVVVAVRIAARTVERTLACDFNRQSGHVARENATPRGEDPFHAFQLYQRGLC